MGPEPNCWADTSASQLYLTPADTGASASVHVLCRSISNKPERRFGGTVIVSRRGHMASKAVNKKMRRKAKRKSAGRRKRTSDGDRRRWSQQVTEQSDALTLDKGVFTQRDPKRIAASLKRSALRSTRRKAEPYRSALSMLTFYINRAGRNLPASRKKTQMRAKDELRRQFGRD